MSARGGTESDEDYDLVKFALESSLARTATATAVGMQGQSFASIPDDAPAIAKDIWVSTFTWKLVATVCTSRGLLLNQYTATVALGN